MGIFKIIGGIGRGFLFGFYDGLRVWFIVVWVRLGVGGRRFFLGVWIRFKFLVSCFGSFLGLKLEGICR